MRRRRWEQRDGSSVDIDIMLWGRNGITGESRRGMNSGWIKWGIAMGKMSVIDNIYGLWEWLEHKEI